MIPADETKGIHADFHAFWIDPNDPTALLYSALVKAEYSRINEYRLPSYHRLDFAAINTPKKNERRKKLKTEWVFSIYNLYSRKNPYFIYFDQTGNPFDGTLKVQGKQVSLFPIIPAVTWNFKF